MLFRSEVNMPGGYPIQREMSLVQAVAAAGGAKQTAQLKSVMILRRSKNEGVKSFRIDLNNVVHKGYNSTTEDELYVQAQDVIYVPRTFIANVDLFLSQVYEGFLPPLDIYVRALLYKR